MLAIVATGCGGTDEPPAPSCQQAMTHYYGAGCTFVDLNTGQPIPLMTSIKNCQELLVVTPERCLDESADERACLGGVRSPATGAADCDCSSEHEAVLTCE